MASNPFQIPQALIAQNPRTMILRIDSSAFAQYGRVLKEIAVNELIDKADHLTEIPTEGNLYVADLDALHQEPQASVLGQYFGFQEIEIGYCNGKNTTINGVEYHKSPELFIAVTDCLQFLTRFDRLKDFSTVDTLDAELFYFPKGSAVLIDPLVLHLSPCAVHKEGFKSIIVLPKQTNEPLSKAMMEAKRVSTDAETRILFKQNKWMLAHPERQQLIRNGVPIGLAGLNRGVQPLD
jgi:hypothetical protein